LTGFPATGAGDDDVDDDADDSVAAKWNERLDKQWTNIKFDPTVPAVLSLIGLGSALLLFHFLFYCCSCSWYSSLL